MLTLFGKVLVFVLVALSLAGLGVSLWFLVDHREWKKELDEAKSAFGQEEKSVAAIKKVKEDEIKRTKDGDYAVVWETQPAAQTIPAKEARGSVAALKDQDDKYGAMLTTLRDRENTDIARLKKARADFEAGVAVLKDLREQIEAPKVDGRPQEAFEALIEKADQERRAAEQAQQDTEPKLQYAKVGIQLLLKRHEQLLKRLDELKVTGAAAQKP